MSQSASLERLQALLRELLQLDLSDLDFGLYRLLRLKRSEIEAFLTEQLPRRVREAFTQAADTEGEALDHQLARLRDQIRQTLGPEAIDAEGRLAASFENTPVGRQYREIQHRRVAVQASEARQAEVFNHLYNFFARYYEDGDFISRRYYGARERFAVPYNGEEVFFHWANRDQHYVKTGEVFRDYGFTVEAGLDGPARVRFVLSAANLPPGNTKGDARYFFPLTGEATWSAEQRVFTLPFHFRLPVEADQVPAARNGRAQDAILEAALPAILGAVPDPGLSAALAEPAGEGAEPRPSLLLRRLRHFTRRNTTDYFVHRNLKGFLQRELEFYLKDQVLNLGDLDADLGLKLRTLRAVRRVAGEVIEFLHQLEEVQRRLFEKRKFVLRTDWLVLVKDVPRGLWPEVLANAGQRESWRELFAVNPDDLDEVFLEQHPTLVVDTRHFDTDFGSPE